VPKAGIVLDRCSAVLPHVVEHIGKRFFQSMAVDPEPDFLADLFRAQHVRLVKNFEVMRHRGAGQCRDGGNLAYVEPLALVEQQQDALAVFIAQGREHTGHRLPFGRDEGSGGAVLFHIDNISYVDMRSQQDVAKNFEESTLFCMSMLYS